MRAEQLLRIKEHLFDSDDSPTAQSTPTLSHLLFGDGASNVGTFRPRADAKAARKPSLVWGAEASSSAGGWRISRPAVRLPNPRKQVRKVRPELAQKSFSGSEEKMMRDTSDATAISRASSYSGCETISRTSDTCGRSEQSFQVGMPSKY